MTVFNWHTEDGRGGLFAVAELNAGITAKVVSGCHPDWAAARNMIYSAIPESDRVSARRQCEQAVKQGWSVYVTTTHWGGRRIVSVALEAGKLKSQQIAKISCCGRVAEFSAPLWALPLVLDYKEPSTNDQYSVPGIDQYSVPGITKFDETFWPIPDTASVDAADYSAYFAPIMPPISAPVPVWADDLSDLRIEKKSLEALED